MKLIFIVLATVVFSNASSQDYAFKVLINKGQNRIKSGNNWLPIKVGASLQSADELKISPNGYLGLVHATGKPLEVKNAGEHKVADLAAQVSGGSSVLNKYTDFILSAAEKKSNTLAATGAVHRGLNEIKVFLPNPKQAIVFKDKISIAWARNPRASTYVVSLHSMFGDELDRFELQDTTLVIDLSKPNLVNEDNIVVEVSSKGQKDVVSDSFVLKKLSPADKARITNSLEHIASQTSEQTALNNLFLASFFEDNKLLIDAATSYQEAIKLAPNVPYFQDAFNAFLTRNGLRSQ
jgi:hypothetical protein